MKRMTKRAAYAEFQQLRKLNGWNTGDQKRAEWDKYTLQLFQEGQITAKQLSVWVSPFEHKEV